MAYPFIHEFVKANATRVLRVGHFSASDLRMRAYPPPAYHYLKMLDALPLHNRGNIAGYHIGSNRRDRL